MNIRLKLSAKMNEVATTANESAKGIQYTTPKNDGHRRENFNGIKAGG